MEEKKKKPVEKKELRCPFDESLSCENCRLYTTYSGGGGLRSCVFVQAR